MSHFPNNIRDDDSSTSLSVVRFVLAIFLVGLGVHLLGVHVGSISSILGILVLALCAVGI